MPKINFINNVNNELESKSEMDLVNNKISKDIPIRVKRLDRGGDERSTSKIKIEQYIENDYQLEVKKEKNKSNSVNKEKFSESYESCGNKNKINNYRRINLIKNKPADYEDSDNNKNKHSLDTGKAEDGIKMSVKKKKLNNTNSMGKEPIYQQNEYCKKYCGEKLFKNLGLNQRFYIRNNGDNMLHNVGCVFYNIKSSQSRTKSVSTSYREKRKISVEKDMALLDLSLAVIKSTSVMNSSKKIKNPNLNYEKINNDKIKNSKTLCKISYANFNNNECNNPQNESISPSKNLSFIKFVEENKIKDKSTNVSYPFVFFGTFFEFFFILYEIPIFIINFRIAK